MARQPTFSSHDALLDGSVSVKLDLHGLTELEARAAFEKLIKASSGKLVHVITGKGKSSKGQPVLKQLVRSMLKGSLARSTRDWTLDAGDGGYRILVR